MLLAVVLRPLCGRAPSGRAGAQRRDPKAGDPAPFPHGHGPRGDVIRILNSVRLVRGGGVTRR